LILTIKLGRSDLTTGKAKQSEGVKKKGKNGKQGESNQKNR